MNYITSLTWLKCKQDSKQILCVLNVLKSCEEHHQTTTTDSNSFLIQTNAIIQITKNQLNNYWSLYITCFFKKHKKSSTKREQNQCIYNSNTYERVHSDEHQPMMSSMDHITELEQTQNSSGSDIRLVMCGNTQRVQQRSIWLDSGVYWQTEYLLKEKATRVVKTWM